MSSSPLEEQELMDTLVNTMKSIFPEGEDGDDAEVEKKAIEAMSALAQVAFKNKTPGERLEIAINTVSHINSTANKHEIAPLVSFVWAMRNHELAERLFADWCLPQDDESEEDFKEGLKSLEDQVTLFGTTFTGVSFA